MEYGIPLQIAELKAAGDAWEVSGYASTFGNVDHGGDAVMRGAFDSTLDRKTPVRFLFGHDTRQVLGAPLELRPDDKGLFGRFKISQTQLGRDVHTLLQDKALDSFSIGYVPTDVEFDDIGTRILKSVDLLECSIVALPMNDGATVTSVKEQMAWNPSTASMNDLPDSAFAIILGGGKKDSEGKTTPRSLRKLPHHDPDGGVNPDGVRAALRREPSANMSAEEHATALGHLRRHARKLGIESGGNGSGSKDDHGAWGEIDSDVPFEDLLAQVKGYLILGCDEAEALAARRAEIGRKLASGHTEAIDELLREAEACAERLHRLLAPPPDASQKADGDLELRLELARRLERRRDLVGVTD